MGKIMGKIFKEHSLEIYFIFGLFLGAFLGRYIVFKAYGLY